jgi:hypothetical protein
MLIYTATYPRCGSALLRRMIRLCFEEATSNGYTADHPRAVPTDDPDVIHPKWREGGRRQLYMVAEPALERLKDPATRERLAARPDPLFVKTHELPYETWFPGEAAIQMVRHPAAAILSYSRINGATVEDTAEGRCYAGSWSVYHRAWRETGLPIGRVRYEDNFGDQEDALQAVERLIGRTAQSRDFETPEDATARDAARNPGRGPNGWREVLTPAQVELIWALHGGEAARYGYQRDNADVTPSEILPAGAGHA